MQSHAEASRAPRPTTASRLLAWASWLGLVAAVLIAATAVFCQWGVNAGFLGAHDMGLALSFAWIAAFAFIASLYATPVLVALGLVSLFFQCRAGLRFLAAGAVTALPVALLNWLV